MTYTIEWMRKYKVSGKVLTIYELVHKATGDYKEFLGLDENFMLSILQLVEKQGKCVIIKNSQGRSIAVKFL